MNYDDLIFEAYLPMIQESFKHHPDRDMIIHRMQDGDFTFDDVDRWFAEAEMYSWLAFKEIREELHDGKAAHENQDGAHYDESNPRPVACG